MPVSVQKHAFEQIRAFLEKSQQLFGSPPPSFLGRLSGYFRPSAFAERGSSRSSAHTAEGDGRGVFGPRFGGGPRVLDLASRDLGDHDGAGVHVGGPFFVLGATGHFYAGPCIACR
jgi:hypothetical protein